jgi:hypothetical protein
MTDKNGTIPQHRCVEFDDTPATGMSMCPFKGPAVAIVPVRYALDRTHRDADSDELKTRLKPLPAAGKWADLPDLKTRAYTLRQLYDGYVYVFDETDRTFHEYVVKAADASLTRIVWTEAQLGKDSRPGAGEAKPYLLYPRGNRLHLAFSPMQWTWRLCEHMRSNADSRAKWMKVLDLASYCITMAEPGTLPLRRIAEVVADIDAGIPVHDGRFDDTSVPTSSAGFKDTGTACEPQLSAVGSDAHWLGSVPDKDSALFIALDDPLAIFNDLGLQLAADQAAYRVWQEEHGHKLEMARTVTNLCASSDNPEGLPALVKGDVVRTQSYLHDVDEYLDQLHLEEIVMTGGNQDSYVGMDYSKSPEMKSALLAKYGKAPDRKEFETWKQRAKWRREVDVKGARAYISEHQPLANSLLQQIRDTQADFREWAEHIGLDPAVLFVDTTNIKSLLYLQTVMSDLLTVYTQDMEAQDWLLEQEEQATSLFGTLRYGFSPAIKEALHQEADQLLKGMNDFTNVASRVGEISAALTHPDVKEPKWLTKLSQSARDTYSALRTSAAGIGKDVAESILVALLPIDARNASGKQKNLVAVLRSLLIGQALLGSTQQLAIDAEVGAKLKAWKTKYSALNRDIEKLKGRWLYPGARHDRKSLSHQISKVEDEIQKHQLKLPDILDYQDKRYTLSLRENMRAYMESGVKTMKAWEARAKDWIIRLGPAIAPAITWGVIMMNLINTALTYAELTRDGEFSGRDMVKVGYGLAYSMNLLMGVFVQAPWAVVKGAQPLIIDGKLVGILHRSSAYWISRGNVKWGTAVKGFRGGMLVLGWFGIVAAALELYDLYGDLKNSKSSEESAGIIVKGFAVGLMGLGALIPITVGIFPASAAAAVVLSSWFTIVLAIAGIVYLVATGVLNYLQQDGVGWWLRKSSWSLSREHRLPDNPTGHAEELSTLLEIQNCPTIFVQSTSEDRMEWVGRSGYIPQTVQSGAWIQISLPSSSRGKTLSLSVISTERSYSTLNIEKSGISIAQPFLNNGRFSSTKDFSIINKEFGKDAQQVYFPEIPPADEAILWQVWVPLSKTAGFIELQIFPPAQTLICDSKARAYLYQIELNPNGEIEPDGLIKTKLTVQAADPAETIALEVPFDTKGLTLEF